jgi:hypothetical protein
MEHGIRLPTLALHFLDSDLPKRVRAWKYEAPGIPAGLVQLRPEKIQPLQETRHPHSQEDERNRSKSGSSSQRPLG